MAEDSKEKEVKPICVGDLKRFKASMEIPPQKPEPPKAPVVDTDKNKDNG